MFEKRVLIWAALLSVCYAASALLAIDRALISTEIWALYYASGPLSEHISAIRQDLVHPPLMYAVHRLWILVFGSSDAAVRALPIVITVPTLFLFTHLAARATRHWRIISFLFCCGYLAGRVQSTTRMYGLVILLATAAILLWDRWRRAPDSRNLAVWAAIMVLLVYTHFAGLLLLTGFALSGALFGPRVRSFFLACAATAAAWLPWFFYVLPVYQQRGIETNLWWVRQFLPNPVMATLRIPAAVLGNPNLSGRSEIALTLLAVALHALLAGIFLWRMRNRDPWHAQAAGQAILWIGPMFLLTSTPVLLLAVYSAIKTPALSFRFVLGIVPAYWLFVGSLSEAAGRTGRWLLYGAFVPWVLVSTAAEFRTSSQPPAIRPALSELASTVGAGDVVLCTGDCNIFYWEWVHRLRRPAPEWLPPPGEPAASAIAQQRLEQGERLNVVRPAAIGNFDPSATLWLVAADEESAMSAARILQNARYRRAGETRRGQIRILRFRKN